MGKKLINTFIEVLRVDTDWVRLNFTDLKFISSNTIDFASNISAFTGRAATLWQGSFLSAFNSNMDQYSEFLSDNTFVHPTTHSASIINETGDRIWYSPGEQDKLDGVENNANNYTHPVAHLLSMINNSATRIKMLQTERDKLDGIATGANNYTHPVSHALSMITNSATRVKMLQTERDKLDGIATGANNYIHPTDHSLSIINESASRVIMLQTEKDKLAGIADNANNYIHPGTHELDDFSDLLDGDGYLNNIPPNTNTIRIDKRGVKLTDLTVTPVISGVTPTDAHGCDLITYVGQPGSAERTYSFSPGVGATPGLILFGGYNASTLTGALSFFNIADDKMFYVLNGNYLSTYYRNPLMTFAADQLTFSAALNNHYNTSTQTFNILPLYYNSSANGGQNTYRVGGASTYWSGDYVFSDIQPHVVYDTTNNTLVNIFIGVAYYAPSDQHRIVAFDSNMGYLSHFITNVSNPKIYHYRQSSECVTELNEERSWVIFYTGDVGVTAVRHRIIRLIYANNTVTWVDPIPTIFQNSIFTTASIIDIKMCSFSDGGDTLNVNGSHIYLVSVLIEDTGANTTLVVNNVFDSINNTYRMALTITNNSFAFSATTTEMWKKITLSRVLVGYPATNKSDFIILTVFTASGFIFTYKSRYVSPVANITMTSGNTISTMFQQINIVDVYNETEGAINDLAGDGIFYISVIYHRILCTIDSDSVILTLSVAVLSENDGLDCITSFPSWGYRNDNPEIYTTTINGQNCAYLYTKPNASKIFKINSEMCGVLTQSGLDLIKCFLTTIGNPFYRTASITLPQGTQYLKSIGYNALNLNTFIYYSPTSYMYLTSSSIKINYNSENQSAMFEHVVDAFSNDVASINNPCSYPPVFTLWFRKDSAYKNAGLIYKNAESDILLAGSFIPSGTNPPKHCFDYSVGNANSATIFSFITSALAMTSGESLHGQSFVFYSFCGIPYDITTSLGTKSVLGYRYRTLFMEVEPGEVLNMEFTPNLIFFRNYNSASLLNVTSRTIGFDKYIQLGRKGVFTDKPITSDLTRTTLSFGNTETLLVGIIASEYNSTVSGMLLEPVDGDCICTTPLGVNEKGDVDTLFTIPTQTISPPTVGAAETVTKILSANSSGGFTYTDATITSEEFNGDSAYLNEAKDSVPIAALRYMNGKITKAYVKSLPNGHGYESDEYETMTNSTFIFQNPYYTTDIYVEVLIYVDDVGVWLKNNKYPNGGLNVSITASTITIDQGQYLYQTITSGRLKMKINRMF